jgi:hypothetical protein
MAFMVKSDEVENGFIRAALASRLFSERPFPDPPAGLDWERLHNILMSHRLTPHFYVLGKSNRSCWPASFRDRLRLERYGLMLYGDQCIARFQPVLAALTEAGIPVIVLKGWALIHTIYGGDYGQRIYDDIDILVAPKDADAAEAILKKLGWRGSGETRPGYVRRYTNAEAYFFFEQPQILDKVFSIGFHWGLLHHPAYNPEQIDIESIIKRAHQLVIAGVPVLEMSVEDQLAYNCTHIVRQHRSEEILLRYYEIAAIISDSKSFLNWQAVMEYASQWKLVFPVKIVVRRIEELWPGIVSSSVLSAIEHVKPSPSEQFIQKWYEKTNYNPNIEHFLTWLTMSGARRRRSSIMQEIFPGRDYLERGYGQAPGGIWPLLYFLRVFRVIGYFLKSIVK